MKEYPIIFSGEMVRAILDGRKTMTRRVIKPQPYSEPIYRGSEEPDYTRFHWKDYGQDEVACADDIIEFCPYGQPGDSRLWVRETWCDVLSEAHYTGNPDDHGGENDPCWGYHATMTYLCGKPIPDEVPRKWKASIHMPRRASRLTLEVTNVRVERLQDISESDANREGCPVPAQDQSWSECRAWFRELWNSINAKRRDKKLISPRWNRWTWGVDERDDPEAIGLDIRDPGDIRWQNVDDIDLTEWVRFTDGEPPADGFYQVIWEEGDQPTRIYLQASDWTEEDYQVSRYDWASNPYVWVIEFKRLEKDK